MYSSGIPQLGHTQRIGTSPPGGNGYIAGFDALAIIVSEETGAISVAWRGQFYLRQSAEELESLLTKES